MARWHRWRQRRYWPDLMGALDRWRRKLGVTGMVSIAALLAIGAAIAILEARGGGGAAAELSAYVAEAGVDPVALIAEQARAHRLVLLGDVDGAAAPKALAAEVIEALALGPGLDAVVLEVPSDLQPVIDRYLNSRSENAALLVGRPALLREWAGASTASLEIYRTVWRLNRELGPGRSIRIVAADVGNWPPRGAIAPRAAAERFAARSEHMAEQIAESILDPFPRARVLVFANGYQVLKTSAELALGGRAPVQVVWLAARLEAEHPKETYSVLVEGTRRGAETPTVTTFRATRFAEMLGQDRRAETPVAVPADAHFDFVADPVFADAGPGLEMTIGPQGYRLSDLVDAYVYLGPR